MDYRLKQFTEKFDSAKKIFNAKSLREIKSIKFREHCINNSDYSRYVDYVRHNLGVAVSPINMGQFQGNAYQVKDKSNNSIIIVEHETGLEILYIAGSVASLIGLVPLAINAWKMFGRRHGFHDRYHDDLNGEAEIRNIDINGNLVEQKIWNVENYINTINFEVYKETENDINEMKKQIAELKAEIKMIKKKQNRKPKIHGKSDR